MSVALTAWNCIKMKWLWHKIHLHFQTAFFYRFNSNVILNLFNSSLSIFFNRICFVELDLICKSHLSWLQKTAIFVSQFSRMERQTQLSVEQKIQLDRIWRSSVNSAQSLCSANRKFRLMNKPLKVHIENNRFDNYRNEAEHTNSLTHTQHTWNR